MSHKITTEIFIGRARVIHGDKYDYSKSVYTMYKNKLEIVCPTHGSFYQSPNSHLRGEGCNRCVLDQIENRRLSLYTTETFISKAKNVHGNKYDYSKVNYEHSTDYISIVCPHHGEFQQQAAVHLLGHGCVKCGKNEMSEKLLYSTSEFVEKCKQIHENKYDYSITVFTHVNNKIKIICPRHGIFEQKANNHVNGSGCPKCAKVLSKSEETWLNSLNIPNDTKHRHVTLKVNDRWFLVDGFDPITNTIYEFYGDYWHGNPKIYNSLDINKVSRFSFGELYSRTINKEQLLKQAGYNIVSIWESDFKETHA